MSIYKELDINWYKTSKRLMLSLTPCQLAFIDELTLEYDCNRQDIIRAILDEYKNRKQRLKFKPRI